MCTENNNLVAQIRTGYTKIVREVEVKGYILDEMISKDVISLELNDNIELVPTREDRTRKLVKHILTSSNSRAAFSFLEALKRDYKYLVDDLVGRESSSEGKDDIGSSSLLVSCYYQFAD